MAKRNDIRTAVRTQVLIESCYRCGNPRCNAVLTLNVHHIVPVSQNGGDDPSNLLPLCGYCHDMFHAGNFPPEMIRHWKGMLVALNHAFSREAMDLLVFISTDEWSQAYYSTDSLVRFSGLLVAGLVRAERHPLTPTDVAAGQYLGKYLDTMSQLPANEKVKALAELRDELFSKWTADEALSVLQRLFALFLHEEADAAEQSCDRAHHSVTEGMRDWYRPLLFRLTLTGRGQTLVDAWLAGDEKAYTQMLQQEPSSGRWSAGP